MKNGNYLLAVTLLAVSTYAGIAGAEGTRQRLSSADEVRQAFSDIEAARQFSDNLSKPNARKTSVRWLASDSDSGNAGTFQGQDVDLPLVLGVTSGSSKSKTSIHSLSRLPTAQAAPTKTRIIQTQAQDEIFRTARALQNEPTPQTDPVTPQADEDYSNADSATDWGANTVSSGACCAAGCCDGGTCATCRPPRKRILVMGTEAVFLNPTFNGNRASFVFDDFAAPAHYNFSPGSADVAAADLDDLYIAPRLWLGVQGECWGVMGRYFHMRAGEHAHDAYIPLTLDHGFDVNSIFEAYYADLELTRNFCLNGSKNQFSFGVRYALIEHDESIIAMAEVDEGLINGGARSNRSAHGTGITFGLNGRKPLFCNSCAHWFYNVRSSVLWGCTHNAVETWSEAILIDPGATAIAGSKDGAHAAINDDLFIGEIQLGIEWDFAMRCLPAKSFFRLAFEYQYWDASSGRAASGSFAGFGAPTATSLGTASADAPGLRVDMAGFHVGTGFTW